MDVGVRSEFGKSLPADMRGYGHHGFQRLLANGTPLQSGPGSSHRLSGLGLTADDIASLIATAGSTALQTIAAQNPGTLYTTDANGNITIYHQPTGTTANLPVSVIGAGAGAGVPYGTVNTPLGSATVAGLSMNTIVLGGVALLAVVLLSRK